VELPALRVGVEAARRHAGISPPGAVCPAIRCCLLVHSPMSCGLPLLFGSLAFEWGFCLYSVDKQPQLPLPLLSQ